MRAWVRIFAAINHSCVGIHVLRYSCSDKLKCQTRYQTFLQIERLSSEDKMRVKSERSVKKKYENILLIL